MIEPTVTITEKDYQYMIEQINWLNCLNAAGVDNWEGIDYANCLYDEMVKELAAWQDSEQDPEQSFRS